MSKDFINLHTQTIFSIGQSLIEPSELFKKVKELDQSGVGVTDLSSLAAAHDSLKYSKEAGVKLIMGLDAYFVDDLANSENVRLRQVVLLAANHQGYKNLLKINREGFDYGILAFKRFISRIDWKLLEKYSEGVICLTGGGQGILAQLLNTRKVDEAKEQAKKLKDIFGDRLGLEIQPHNMKRNATPYNDYEDQGFVNRQLILMGEELGIKVVAACEAKYLNQEDSDGHDVLICDGLGQLKKSVARLKYENEFYLKSREQIVKFFSRNYKEKAEEFCDNSLYFAEMCEQPDWISPKFSNPSGRELPDFPVKDRKDYDDFIVNYYKPLKQLQSGTQLNWQPELGIPDRELTESEAYYRYWCEKNIDSKVPKDKKLEYIARLKEECEVFEHQGFSGYMNITADMLEWCRENDILIGVGRGSGGSSLTAYLTGIHQADPIKYDLVFSRFQNKSRPNPPDLDNDISPQGREKLHEYLKQKYGHDCFAYVSNYNTTTPKVYTRSISRIFNFGNDRKVAVQIGNAIADSIPEDIKTIEKALEEAPLFAAYANSEKYAQLKTYYKFLERKPRSVSTHAGGIILSKRNLSEIVPLRKDKDNYVAIEYEKERVAANGLIKIDTLGLETLDIIDDTYNLIKINGKNLPPEPFPYGEYDEQTYKLIEEGRTNCVFQLGTSSGTIDLCRKIKPKNIEEISIVNALARPSAADYREPYVDAKNGKKKVKLLHPKLERALGPTKNIALYDETLIWIAQDIPGWDLVRADNLRKLTKDKGKYPDKVAKWKQEFIDDSTKNGIEKGIATKIWTDIIDAFQGYGFCKCVSGYTKVIRAGANQYQNNSEITVKKLFEAQNSKTPWGKKIRRGALKILQMDADGVIRPGNIKKIIFNGRKLVMRISTNSGKNIIVTENHRLLTENGYKQVNELSIEDKLVCMSERIYRPNKGFQTTRAIGKKYTGFGMPSGVENPAWIDGRQILFDNAKNQVLIRENEKCEFCLTFNSTKFELAHILSLEEYNGDYTKYHSANNIKHLCNSCHKILDYKKGERKKRWTVGTPTQLEKISNIEILTEEDVYDIEMDTKEHNFVANGIVSHNSHSVLYSFTSYQTAYLKAHYPLEFLTANLISKVNSNQKKAEKDIRLIKEEIRQLQVKIIQPNINKSGMSYSIIDDQTVMTGFDALKFMGKDAIPEILAKRPFTSFEDFLKRVDGRKVRSPAIQALAAAGCLDEFGLTRQQMFLYASDYKKKLVLWLKRKGTQLPFEYPWPKTEEWSIPERYALEMFYLGEGLSGSLAQVYPDFFNVRAINFKELAERYPSTKVKETIELSSKDGFLEGVITDYYEFKVKKEDSKYFGQDMARLTVQDLFGNSTNVVIFSDKLSLFKKRWKELVGNRFKIEAGVAISWIGNLNWYQGNYGIVFENLKKIAPIPAKPSDLKHRKVAMKISSPKKVKGQLSLLEQELLLEELEEELLEEGKLSENDNLDEESNYFEPLDLDEDVSDDQIDNIDELS